MEAPRNWRELEIQHGRPARLASIPPQPSEFNADVERSESGEAWREMRENQETEALDDAARLNHEVNSYISSGILRADEPKGRKFTY